MGDIIDLNPRPRVRYDIDGIPVAPRSRGRFVVDRVVDFVLIVAGLAGIGAILVLTVVLSVCAYCGYLAWVAAQ